MRARLLLLGLATGASLVAIMLFIMTARRLARVEEDAFTAYACGFVAGQAAILAVENLPAARLEDSTCHGYRMLAQQNGFDP